MPLIVETGEGVPLANGYITVDFLTDYLTDRGRLSENNFNTADNAAKEAAIIAASEYLDIIWGPRLGGHRLKPPSTSSSTADSNTQGLEFPRSGLYDRAGRLVTGVPLRVEQATAEYAVRAHSTSLFQDPTTDETGRTVTERSTRVGPIEESVRYEESSTVTQLVKPYPAADNLLSEYITGVSTGRVIR